MASLLKAVYLLIALSIAADLINLRGYWYKNVEDITVHSSSLILPGASGWVAPVLKAAAKVISKSAKKLLRKKQRTNKECKGKPKIKLKSHREVQVSSAIVAVSQRKPSPFFPVSHTVKHLAVSLRKMK